MPVEERPAPTSTVPGERAWRTQPFSAVEALSPQRLTADDAFGLSDEDRAACRETIASLRNDKAALPTGGKATPMTFRVGDAGRQ